MRMASFLVAVGLASLVGSSAMGADTSTQRSNDTVAANNRLLDSANAGDLAGVRAAIVTGASVDAQDMGKMTPLLWAAWRSHLDVAKYLIRHHADVEARGHHGMTPLMMASATGSLGIVDELLKNGADVNASTAGQPESCEAGDRSELFADGRWTALMAGAASGDGAIVRRLVDAGADTTVRDRSGRGVVAYAATAECSDALEALLDLGARIDIPNVRSQTALSEAIANEKTSNALLLIARGADPSILAYNGMKPLFVAINSWATGAPTLQARGSGSAWMQQCTCSRSMFQPGTTDGWAASSTPLLSSQNSRIAPPSPRQTTCERLGTRSNGGRRTRT